MREGLGLPLRADLEKAAGLDGRTLRDCARAAAELAIARICVSVEPVAHLLAPVPQANAADPPNSAQRELLDRVAFAIPRVAARVPWRATCLVQALAAKRWLHRRGIPTELILGAKEAGEDRIDAHAWLKVGERILVGGDVSAYRPFTRTKRP